ncbi:MAG: FHA domain-containing protein [Acidobacteriia bacterium]|nr:FHA domain-containing protein [Terriglobia bacterium]
MANETSEQGTIRYTRCPACGAPNPANAAACARCGKPMPGKESATSPPPSAPTVAVLTCPRCRKALPVGSRFCGFCGAPLTVAPPPAVAKPAPQQQAPTQPVQAVQPRVPRPIPRPVAPAPPPPPPRPVVSRPPAPVPPPIPAAAPPPPPPPQPAAPPQPAEAPPVGEETQVFRGLHIPKVEASLLELKQDGSVGNSVRVSKETSIGRSNCDITFSADALLSPRHASLAVRKEKLHLRDLGSQNGTFIKQRESTDLADGDVFLIGRELFKFSLQPTEEASTETEGTQVIMGLPSLQAPAVSGKLDRIQLNGEVIESYKLEKSETTLGRTKGDLIFKNDPYMSGMHARIVAQSGRFILQDLKSRNGVYRRLRKEVELRNGDEFFLGEQIFRVELKVS